MAKTLYTKEVDAGALKSTSSKAYKFKLEVIENSTSIANDTSNITINFYGAKYSGWGFAQFSSPKGIIAVDGTNKTNDTVSAINSTSYVKISTWTGDIKHNAEGKKTLSVKASFNPNTTSSSYNYVPVKTEIEASVPLTTIPQKSSVTATNAEIEGNTKIEIKRASDSFTHTLKYSFGGLTGTIVTKTSNTSISWTIPTSFYAKIPNNKKGTCTITCETYSGTTLIGSTTTTFEASCNETKCKPTVSATVVDTNQDTINLTNDSSKLIKYKSTAKITPTTTAKNSATISRITIDNVNVTSYLSLANVSKNAFEITVTDSRGFSNTITKNVTMINYVQLTCKADFERTSQTSSEVKLKYSGNYFNGSFGAQNNTLAMSWSYCEKGTNDWISGGILNPTISGNTYSGEISCGTTFDYKKDYEFKLYYADELDNLNLTKDVSKGEGSLEIYDKVLVVGGEDLVTWYNDILKLGAGLLNAIYPVSTLYKSLNDTNPGTIFGGTWELVSKNIIDTGWQDFSWFNSGYTIESYTQNKWRIKDNILYVQIGAGAGSTINTSTETEIARIPIKGNTSYNLSAKRVWVGAVGGGGAVAGFMLFQDSNYVSVSLKPHTSSSFATGAWYSTHFSVPLDQSFTFTSGTYDTKYTWKRVS